MTQLARSLVPALLLAVAAPASAQTVYFRVQIGAPSGGAAPAVQVQEYRGGASLAERRAIQAMWSTLESHMTSAVRECRMPLAVEIDADSFRGQMVQGTEDGLHPGTRSRFTSMVRALTALCHRGDMERGAVQGAIRTVRFGYTTAPTDVVSLSGGTLSFATNGDMTDTGHLGYGAAITWLEEHL